MADEAEAGELAQGVLQQRQPQAVYEAIAAALLEADVEQQRQVVLLRVVEQVQQLRVIQRHIAGHLADAPATVLLVEAHQVPQVRVRAVGQLRGREVHEGDEEVRVAAADVQDLAIALDIMDAVGVDARQDDRPADAQGLEHLHGALGRRVGPAAETLGRDVGADVDVRVNEVGRFHG